MMGVLLQKKKIISSPSICNILSRPLHMNNNLDHKKYNDKFLWSSSYVKTVILLHNHTSMVYRFKKNIYSNL